MVFNSVIKERCFKHLQDIITTYVHDATTILSLTTNLIPSAYFRFKLKSKKLLGTSLSNNGKEKFYRVLSKLKWKRSKCQLFYLPAHGPAFHLPTVNDASKIILLWQPQLLSYELTLSLSYCGIFACSPTLDRLQLKCWPLSSFTIKTSCSKR